MQENGEEKVSGVWFVSEETIVSVWGRKEGGKERCLKLLFLFSLVEKDGSEWRAGEGVVTSVAMITPPRAIVNRKPGNPNYI